MEGDGKTMTGAAGLVGSEGERSSSMLPIIRFPVDQTGVAGLGHQWKFVPGLS